MFFLRCAFFLSIVYVSISCGVGALHSPHAFEAAVASEAAGVANAAVARATAARLTALVRTAVAEPVSGPEDVVLTDAAAPSAPMPIPDPRRRAARAVLTDVR